MIIVISLSLEKISVKTIKLFIYIAYNDVIVCNLKV